MTTSQTNGIIKWNDGYETGIEAVDSQHKQLCDLINQLGRILVDGQNNLNQTQIVLHQLHLYTAQHFQEEESLMRKLELDACHQLQHVREHQRFLEQVTLLSQTVENDDLDAAKQMLKFLTHWLGYHILGCDLVMARQVTAIRQGASPNRAFQDALIPTETTIDPIVKALSDLFEEVMSSQRELMLLNKEMELRVKERTKALSMANQQLKVLALTDALTELPNRRHGLQQLELLWDKAVEQHLPISCLLIDADHFKQVNDSYGHDAGDAVIKQLALTFRDFVRTDDMVCRLGGDEFLIILPNTHLAGATQFAEQLRAKVSQMTIKAGCAKWCGSISIGVADRTDAMHGFEDLVKHADGCNYAAKKAGKNCVMTEPTCFA
ncbi:GGDEF domain-containing protein [Agarivorans albus]|uniref:GGDEF domain-containing protein n=1 Tax=Agarivorans albus TaxID=182262 RepID=UPI001BFE88BE|nr:GGDEF domain-containing protein [Agarivorans albus]